MIFFNIKTKLNNNNKFLFLFFIDVVSLDYVVLLYVVLSLLIIFFCRGEDEDEIVTSMKIRDDNEAPTTFKTCKVYLMRK